MEGWAVGIFLAARRWLGLAEEILAFLGGKAVDGRSTSFRRVPAGALNTASSVKARALGVAKLAERRTPS